MRWSFWAGAAALFTAVMWTVLFTREYSPEEQAVFAQEAPVQSGQPVRVKALRSSLVAGAGVPGTILPDLTIACGEGAVRLVAVQREGKAAMDAATFLRGVGTMPDRAG